MALDDKLKIFNLDSSINVFNLVAKQNDTTGARSFTFRLIKKNQIFDLTGLNIKVGGNKADGKQIFNNCKIINASKGLVELELTTQMLAAAGTLNVELIILQGNVRLSTIPFEIEIIPSVTQYSDIVSSDEFGVLIDAINKADEYGEKLKDGTEKIELTYADKLNSLDSQLSDVENKKATKTEVEVERKRIDLLTKIENGETEGNTELLDIRVGADGNTYDTAGTAIREQFSDIDENIRNTSKDILNSVKDGRTRLYFSWEVGGIASSGDNIISNTRVRTVEKIDFSSMNIAELYIKIPDGYSIIPIAYNKMSNECYIGNWISDNHYFKPSLNDYYRFGIKKNDNSVINSDVGSLFEFTYKEEIYADTLSDNILVEIDKINNCYEDKYIPDWKIGYYINSSGGLQENNTSCITETFLKHENQFTGISIFLNDILQGFTSTFKVGIIKYKLDGTYVSGIYDFFDKDNIPKLESGFKYRFALATETWEAFNDTNINSTQLKALLSITKQSITRKLVDDINDIKIKIETKKYYNKKANFLGDSITYGIASSVTYDKYLQEMWGLNTIRNYGIPGSTISEHSESMAKRCLDMNSDSDLNFVFGGTNDFFRNVPLGEFYTVIDGVRTFSYDNNTFKGSLNLLFKNMKVKFIGKEVICLLPLHRERYTDNTGSQPTELEPNAIGLYFEEYVKAIKEACYIWSVKYIDLYLKSGLQPNIQEIKNKYFGQGDGLHINKYGHEVVAKCIYDNM